MLKLENINIRNKFIFFSIIPFLGFIFLAGFQLNEIRHNLISAKKDKTRHLVEAAHSVVGHFQRLESDGALSQQEAQQAALDAVKNMRYDENEYFWINDMRPYMIMHPYKPALDGQDISGVQDPDGTFLFNEMVAVVQKNGDGYVEYQWAKPGEDKEKTFPKLSYVKEFKPWGWIIGSGIYIDDIQAQLMRQILNTLVVIVLLMILIGFLAFVIARSIVVPIRQVSGQMNDMANGKDISIAESKRLDELGDMLRALLYFREKTQEAKRLEQEQLVQQEKRLQRQNRLLDISNEFEQSSSSIIETVAAASAQLAQMSEAMVQDAEKTTNLSVESSHFTEATASNVSSVASATEELSSSVQEIVQQINQTMQAVNETVENVGNANANSNALHEASENIQEITSIIREIADQINLLSLNATIEAARAGEAGKGFAVVANEVKSLASQTAQATAQVEEQVSNIRNVSDGVRASLEHVSQSVGRINEYSSSISSAMEEQTAVTEDISRNMQNASTEVEGVKSNIQKVNASSENLKTSSVQVKDAAKSLMERAKEMKDRTTAFLSDLQQDD